MNYVAEIARIAHEANRAYCLMLGDISQPRWEDAPEWQVESAIAGVNHVIQNPEAKPEDSHKSWLAVKEADGWEWGLVKDPVRKLHPCVVAYAELPEEQRRKDHLFLAVVKSMLVEIS